MLEPNEPLSLLHQKRTEKKKERKIEFSTKIEFLKIRGNDYLIAKKMETKTNISNKSQVYHLFYLFFFTSIIFFSIQPFRTPKGTCN